MTVMCTTKAINTSRAYVIIDIHIGVQRYTNVHASYDVRMPMYRCVYIYKVYVCIYIYIYIYTY